MDVNIQLLFPTPVYQTNLRKTFNEEELEFIRDCSKNVKHNRGNIITNGSYLLDQKPMKKLKEELQLHLENYYKLVIQTQDKIFPYITQSWINFTEKGQFHHEHLHANSLVSGVLYFDVDEKDVIKFHKRVPATIFFQNCNYNHLNSTEWNLAAKKGDLLLFPSSLLHSVPVKETDGFRVSLSFNTFVEGHIGDSNSVVELKLPKNL